MDETEQRLAFVRERALRDEISFIKDATKRGRAAGLKEGLEQGLLKGETRILTKQINMKFGQLPSWVNDKVEQATPEKIENWSVQILSAESLGELFKT